MFFHHWSTQICMQISDPWFQKHDQFSSMIPQMWYSLIPDPCKNCWSRSHGLWSLIPGLRSQIPPFRSLIPHTSLRPCWKVSAFSRSRLKTNYLLFGLVRCPGRYYTDRPSQFLKGRHFDDIFNYRQIKKLLERPILPTYTVGTTAIKGSRSY